jgi:hypothetical protein
MSSNKKRYHDAASNIKSLFNRDPPYANYAATTNNLIGGYDVS